MILNGQGGATVIGYCSTWIEPCFRSIFAGQSNVAVYFKIPFVSIFLVCTLHTSIHGIFLIILLTVPMYTMLSTTEHILPSCYC